MEFIKALRVGPSVSTPHGYVRHGLVYDIPAGALGPGWKREGAERVTEPASGPGSVNWHAMTVRELKWQLDSISVTYPAAAVKADLVKLLEADDDGA